MELERGLQKSEKGEGKEKVRPYPCTLSLLCTLIGASSLPAGFPPRKSMTDRSVLPEWHELARNEGGEG